MAKDYKFNNHAAVLIIHDSCSGRYLFQRKSSDYPIKKFANKLGLFGGNWTEAKDNSPLETVLREIEEELHEMSDRPFLGELIKNVEPFAEYEIIVPSNITKRGDIRLTSSVFVSRFNNQYSLESEEGKIEKIPLDRIKNESFCWGYNWVLNDYLGAKLAKGQKGISAKRLETNPLLEYALRNMDKYRINPIREKLKCEGQVFNTRNPKPKK